MKFLLLVARNKHSKIIKRCGQFEPSPPRVVGLICKICHSVKLYDNMVSFYANIAELVSNGLYELFY